MGVRSLALLAAAAGVVVWWALELDGRVALWPQAALAGLVAVGAAVVGKLAGLAAAEVWLWWVGRRLHRFAAAPTAEGVEPSAGHWVQPR